MNLQRWKDEAEQLSNDLIIVPTPKAKLEAENGEFQLEIMDLVAKIKSTMVKGYINTGTRPPADTSVYYNFGSYVNTIKSIIQNSSVRTILPLAVSGDRFTNINSVRTEVTFNIDSREYIAYIKKIVAGRRSHAKGSNRLVVNEFILDYESLDFRVRSDTDKRFNTDTLEVYKRLINPLVNEVNGKLTIIGMPVIVKEQSNKIPVNAPTINRQTLKDILGDTLSRANDLETEFA